MFAEQKQPNEGSWGTRSKSRRNFAYTWGKPQEKHFDSGWILSEASIYYFSLMGKWHLWDSSIKWIGKSFRKCLSGAEAANSSTLESPGRKPQVEWSKDEGWGCAGGGARTTANTMGVAFRRWKPVLSFSSTDVDSNSPTFKVFLTKEVGIFFPFLMSCKVSKRRATYSKWVQENQTDTLHKWFSLFLQEG